jgi:hypothetical protein
LLKVRRHAHTITPGLKVLLAVSLPRRAGSTDSSPNVSQDGRFYMFTSNWEETGRDARDRAREDAFVVRLQRE